VARGYSSKEIAHRLGISPYTVQDHLDHAAEKVGVRGRRALLAKLFFDGHARHLHGRSAAAKST
jgi:DNA-binding CsgD family transcriptional regulator